MSNSNLDTGIKLVTNVGRFNYGVGSIKELSTHVNARRIHANKTGSESHIVFVVDEYFSDQPEILACLRSDSKDRIEFVSTIDEPKTAYIDKLVSDLVEAGFSNPAALIGIGGGITLDTTKAVANLLTNGGKAEQYQGWDLVKIPGIYKIGIPTISGTGAEATRTCVMTNTHSGLKLGMNSDYTVFDHIILDPELTATVPRDQYFYTGMDTYIHCVESLTGHYRNPVGDAYSREALSLCRKVFFDSDMMCLEAREKLMVASYLGGCAIATSYVGLIHPLSAGLSVVLGVHHCLANCIVMRAMSEFYPEAYSEFWNLVKTQNITIPSGITQGLTDEQYCALYDASIIHEKPLTNFLGSDFRNVLTFDKVMSLFQKM